MGSRAAGPAPGAGSRTPGQAPYPRYSRAQIRRHRIVAIALGLVFVLLVLAGVTYFYLDSRLNRVQALVPSGTTSAGSNWLIAGVPGHVSTAQARQYHTGLNPDANSDTILLLHLPANGNPPVLVSIPRDSYVPIPGYGWNKINAAYVFGGAPLLVRTVQNATGLTINHFLNIGYTGLINSVNAVGGVTLCFKHRIHDQASGLRLKKGCDTLDGKQALAFVRTRHPFGTQDLQREQNQRVFIKALISKMTSPGTLLNPFAIIPASVGSAGALTVDSGTHLYQLIPVAFALRNPETTTVPIANANFFTNAGDAVQWDHAQASKLFADLAADRPVPAYLLTGSKLAG